MEHFAKFILWLLIRCWSQFCGGSRYFGKEKNRKFDVSSWNLDETSTAPPVRSNSERVPRLVCGIYWNWISLYLVGCDLRTKKRKDSFTEKKFISLLFVCYLFDGRGDVTWILKCWNEKLLSVQEVGILFLLNLNVFEGKKMSCIGILSFLGVIS